MFAYGCSVGDRVGNASGLVDTELNNQATNPQLGGLQGSRESATSSMRESMIVGRSMIRPTAGCLSGGMAALRVTTETRKANVENEDARYTQARFSRGNTCLAIVPSTPWCPRTAVEFIWKTGLIRRWGQNGGETEGQAWA